MAEPITTPCRYRYPDDPDGPPCGHPADAWRHSDPRGHRYVPEPDPTCRHCGAPDLAPWDAADAGMAGDYCARCVDDAVLGAPCPACGNVPGDDDPCPSR